jgi:small-conductance mechanosensitive channel
LLLGILLCLAALPATALAQEGPETTPAPEETPIEAPEEVDVQPTARDDEIRDRLQSILEATGWFIDPEVRVQDGVVFLTGQTETDEFKKWAGDLARSTQSVAAVVNQIEVLEPPVWDFQPVLTELDEQGRGLVHALPIIAFGLLFLILSVGAARLAVGITRKALRRRVDNPLLLNVIAWCMGLGVLLVGLYIVFQVAGLTNVAVTVLGTTGLLGLILGIAFRDITENFLASIFLSVQPPFHAGDLVEIADLSGFVQMLTTRTTVLMTQDGNHVQIPNATVYKSVIHNYTSNPNRRIDFAVGIGYDDNVAAAQEVALRVLEEHPAVLKDPEPWVLVDNLGASTVNLRIFFWLDATQHNFLKVRSSVIRLVKRAFEVADISMPGETRELVFPDGIPFLPLAEDMLPPEEDLPRRPTAARAAKEPDTLFTAAEGTPRSEAEEIEEQARHARSPEEGDNLLQPPGG